jgi:hypothetical protein
MSEPIYENAHYAVYTTDNALGEDGNYGMAGYAVVNKETQVIEHTTMVLPQALFQADAFMGALGQLEATEDTDDGILGGSSIEIDPTIQ